MDNKDFIQQISSTNKKDILKQYLTTKFLPLGDDYNQIILLGGRGCRKSISTAIYFIISCIYDPYFKGIMYGKTEKILKDSQYDTIKQISSEIKTKTGSLNDYFEFLDSSFTIKCKFNNNTIIGLTPKQPFKSILEPTCLWLEEITFVDEMTEIDTMNTFRSSRAKIKYIITINPNYTTSFEEDWFYKKYFQNKPNPYDWTDTQVIEDIEIKTICIHSTYKDNPYINNDFKAKLESIKNNPYIYNTQVLGIFTPLRLEGLVYNQFNENLISEYKIQKDLNIQVSFDFNINPYCSSLFSQYDSTTNKTTYFKEIISKYPNNSLISLMKLIIEYLKKEDIKFINICGDVSGNKKEVLDHSTSYNYIESCLRDNNINYKKLISSINAPVKKRIEWINDKMSRQEIQVYNCPILLEDIRNQKISKDGGNKEKKVIKDKVRDISYQQYGHLSDCLDYTECQFHYKEFYEYLNKKQKIITTTIEIAQSRKNILNRSRPNLNIM